MSAALPIQDVVGYDLEDLRAFLVAADRRAEELRAAVATAKVAALAEEQPDAADRRRRVADAWVTAQREAARIRAEADRDAAAVLDAARRLVGGDPASTTHPTGVGPGGRPSDTDQADG